MTLNTGHGVVPLITYYFAVDCGNGIFASLRLELVNCNKANGQFSNNVTHRITISSIIIINPFIMIIIFLYCWRHFLLLTLKVHLIQNIICTYICIWIHATARYIYYYIFHLWLSYPRECHNVRIIEHLALASVENQIQWVQPTKT